MKKFFIIIVTILTILFLLSLIAHEGTTVKNTNTGETIQTGERAMKSNNWIDTIDIPNDRVIVYAMIGYIDKRVTRQALSFRTDENIDDLIAKYVSELIQNGWSEVEVKTEEKIEESTVNAGEIKLQSFTTSSPRSIFGKKDYLRIDITFSTYDIEMISDDDNARLNKVDLTITPY